LKTNFDKILPIVKKTLDDQLNEKDNLQAYPNPPDLQDAHIITLSLLQEALSIDSEHFFWSKLTSDYPEAFPDLPHLTNYNRRRKQYRTAPDKGYSASLDHYFIGYKLHVVLTLDGVYHSMELTKGSVHDSQYLA